MPDRAKRDAAGFALATNRWALFALAPLSAFAPKGLLLAFLLVAPTGLRRGAAAALWREHRLLALGVLAFCAWVLVSLSFAPEPNPWRAIGRVTMILAGLLWIVGLRDLQRRTGTALDSHAVAALWLAIALFLLQLLSDGALTRLWYVRTGISEYHLHESIAVGTVLLACLIWPAVGWLWQRGRRVAGAVAAGLAAACIVALPMAAATLGVFAGSVAFLFALRWPRATPALLLLGAATYAVFAPALSAQWLTIDAARSLGLDLPSNWEHRLGISRYVAGEIAATGPHGAGFGAARAIAARDEKIMHEYLTGELASRGRPALPLHPHNVALQMRLELGWPGIGALALIYAGLGAGLLRLPPGAPRASATAALAALLSPLHISYGLWQGWWLATVMLVAAATVLLAGARAAPAIADGR